MRNSRQAVLEDRFLHDGETCWEDVCTRVARAWGTCPAHGEAIFDMMASGDALPNTPAIANAGRPKQMASACFVLPVEDSLTEGDASIMQTLKDAAAIHQSGGGTGFNFGRIRGRGELVSSTGRPAPGAVNVLRLYSDAIHRVTQAGMRPGANMGILPIDHPDIVEFITAKGTESDITNFNISVAIDDDFMHRLQMGDLTDRERFVWDAIVDGSWRNGEPGVFFVDAVNWMLRHPERIEATNPCVTGDTVIATVGGPRSFEDLAASEDDVDVFAWDPETKLPVVRTMRRPHKTRESVPVVAVEFDSGLVVRCTTDHVFYSFRGEKVRADELQVGSSVLAWTDTPEYAEGVNHKVVDVRDDGFADVYNGCVDGAHTYIILDPSPVAGVMSGIVSANCGEVPLRPYEACVLGSVNLANHLRVDPSTDMKVLDVAKLRRTVFTLVELLDNVIDRQDYPLPEIEREQKRYRKIGVGVMGFADALCDVGVKYGSEESVRLADEWMCEVQDASYSASKRLGQLRGVYDGYQPGMWATRNLYCNVIAPTGTISRLAECSFGIEPHFRPDDTTTGEYYSFILGGQFVDRNRYYNSPVFTPSNEVTLAQHIAIQAAFQRCTDQAVSKTINCPFETTHAEISDAYIAAWEANCKGLTILRDGAREKTVIGVREGDCNGAACSV